MFLTAFLRETKLNLLNKVSDELFLSFFVVVAVVIILEGGGVKQSRTSKMIYSSRNYPYSPGWGLEFPEGQGALQD